MKEITKIILIIIFYSMNTLLADGKFYGLEKVPPTIPYQRALIIFDGHHETLLLQSKYDKYDFDSQKKHSLGWIVPVPSIPNLASMPADRAQKLFFSLGFRSRPVITRVSLYIAYSLCFCAMALLIILCFFSYFDKLSLFPTFHRYRVKIFISTFFLLIISSMGFPSLGIEGIEVIKTEKIGIYDIQVVKAQKADKLIHWLNKNNFKFNDADKSNFESYIKRNWCFVVAKLQIENKLEKREIITEGLVAPLILRFKTNNCIYPLALTATIGHNTQVLLYVVSQQKMISGGRLKLQYAGRKFGTYFENFLKDCVVPKDFFADSEENLSWLCKFKGILTSGQMQQDLHFNQAKDSEVYRERKVKW